MGLAGTNESKPAGDHLNSSVTYCYYDTNLFNGYAIPESNEGGQSVKGLSTDELTSCNTTKLIWLNPSIDSEPDNYGYRLEKGYYTINFSNSLGMYFVKEKIELNKLYRLPNDASDLVLNDISKFWTLEDTYKKYHRVFRRNYLLYSAPGTGKTSLINLMCEELINVYDGIVFSLSTENQIEAFPEAVRRIRKIEPDRKIIAIIEDIDTFTQGSSRLNTLLLNILDGNLKLGGLVTIATTNHIEYLEDRYTNRPSRFDRVVEFPLPNAESRKMFIEKTVLPEDLEKIDLDEWVAKTEGFTIDHINEIILLFFVFGHSEEEAFNSLFAMTKTKGALTNKTSVSKRDLGFA